VGFLVATTGRLLLPEQLERQALTVAEHRMAAREGGFDPDSASTVDSLAELAAYAGVRLERDGDWLRVSTDHHGDPKWSEQAEEFYRSMAGFVQEGEVHLRGADGNAWSYAYSAAGMQQQGSHGRDEPPPGAASGAATHPGSSPPDAPLPPPVTPPPATPPQAASPPGPAGPEPADPTTAPPESGTGFVDYPGRTAGPPREEEPPSTPPGVRDAGWAGTDDDPPPAPPGRVLLMTVVLVVGVALIIGLALLVSGF
jgi:hypothetical protein